MQVLCQTGVAIDSAHPLWPAFRLVSIFGLIAASLLPARGLIYRYVDVEVAGRPGTERLRHVSAAVNKYCLSRHVTVTGQQKHGGGDLFNASVPADGNLFGINRKIL